MDDTEFPATAAQELYEAMDDHLVDLNSKGEYAAVAELAERMLLFADLPLNLRIRVMLIHAGFYDDPLSSVELIEDAIGMLEALSDEDKGRGFYRLHIATARRMLEHKKTEHEAFMAAGGAKHPDDEEAETIEDSEDFKQVSSDAQGIVATNDVMDLEYGPQYGPMPIKTSLSKDTVIADDAAGMRTTTAEVCSKKSSIVADAPVGVSNRVTLKRKERPAEAVVSAEVLQLDKLAIAATESTTTPTIEVTDAGPPSPMSEDAPPGEHRPTLSVTVGRYVPPHQRSSNQPPTPTSSPTLQRQYLDRPADPRPPRVRKRASKDVLRAYISPSSTAEDVADDSDPIDKDGDADMTG